MQSRLKLLDTASRIATRIHIHCPAESSLLGFGGRPAGLRFGVHATSELAEKMSVVVSVTIDRLAAASSL
jgi:hypothetical protein